MGNMLSQMKASLQGVPQGPVVTDMDRAIVSIQRTKRTLRDHKNKQDMLSQRAAETVAELLRERKRERALVALKKKKLHDRQALQLEHNILLLDERMAALETNAQQADLIGALKSANGAIKAMQRQAPLEDVEQLLQENADASQYVADVNALLGQSGESVPDQELDEELAEMESAAFPAAPVHNAQPEAVSVGMEPQAQPAQAGDAEASTANVSAAHQASAHADELPSVPSPSAQVVEQAGLPMQPAAATSISEGLSTAAVSAHKSTDQASVEAALPDAPTHAATSNAEAVAEDQDAARLASEDADDRVAIPA